MEANPELWDEMAQIAEIQDSLSSLTEEDIEDLIQLLTAAHMLETRSGLSRLIRLIRGMCSFRAEKIPIYAHLLSELKTLVTVVDLSKFTMTHLFRACFDACQRPVDTTILFLMHQLMLHNVFSADDFVSKLAKYSRMELYIIALASFSIFFGPEIVERDRVLFNNLLIARDAAFAVSRRIQRLILQYGSRDHWDELRRDRAVMHCNDKYIKMFMEDDIQALRELVATPDLDLNAPIEVTPLCPFYHLDMRPSLIGMAAGLGASNCFRFLLSLGAKTDLLTDNKTSLVQLAVDAGNIEILRILEEHQCDFCGCLQAAVTFFRRDIMDWFLSTHEVDLEERAPTGSTLMNQAASSNNVRAAMYGIEHGAALNGSDGGNERPIMRGAAFNSVEVCTLLIQQQLVREDMVEMIRAVDYAAAFGFTESLSLVMPYVSLSVTEAIAITESAIAGSQMRSLKILLDVCHLGPPCLADRSLLFFDAACQQPDERIMELLLERYGCYIDPLFHDVDLVVPFVAKVFAAAFPEPVRLLWTRIIGNVKLPTKNYQVIMRAVEQNGPVRDVLKELEPSDAQ